MNKHNNSSMIHGNSIDIVPQTCDSEIKADIVVSEFHSVRLWGQIVNCNGTSVANALIKLVKIVTDCKGKTVYQGIAHTVSDSDGFYQFDLCVDTANTKYKVLVNKAATGTERIIDATPEKGSACMEITYTPCGEYKYRITPPDDASCPKANAYTSEKNNITGLNTDDSTCTCNKDTSKDYCIDESAALPQNNKDITPFKAKN